MDPFGMMYLVGLPTGACLVWCYETYTEYKEHKRIIKKEKEQGWKYIGKIEFMCIYPIDGGRAYKEEQAYFGKFGLRTDPVDEKACYDRGYILYNSSNPPTAILRDEKISRTTNHSKAVNQLWNLLKSVSTNIAPREKPSKIQYLDGIMNLHDAGDIIAEEARNALGIQDKAIRLGYYPQDFKKAFNNITKAKLLDTHNGNFCLVNYASFTMVNSESINELKNATGRSDLSYKNFRPQVVFKGIKPYIEDGARFLKIGNLEFSNVTPCVHRNDVNFKFNSQKPRSSFMFGKAKNEQPEVEHTQPFEFLKIYRQLGKLDNHFLSSVDPVFGINFQCDTENEELRNEDGLIEGHFCETCGEPPNVIKKGYNVFVKY